MPLSVVNGKPTYQIDEVVFAETLKSSYAFLRRFFDHDNAAVESFFNRNTTPKSLIEIIKSKIHEITWVKDSQCPLDLSNPELLHIVMFAKIINDYALNILEKKKEGHVDEALFYLQSALALYSFVIRWDETYRYQVHHIHHHAGDPLIKEDYFVSLKRFFERMNRFSLNPTDLFKQRMYDVESKTCSTDKCRCYVSASPAKYRLLYLRCLAVLKSLQPEHSEKYTDLTNPCINRTYTQLKNYLNHHPTDDNAQVLFRQVKEQKSAVQTELEASTQKALDAKHTASSFGTVSRYSDLRHPIARFIDEVASTVPYPVNMRRDVFLMACLAKLFSNNGTSNGKSALSSLVNILMADPEFNKLTLTNKCSILFILFFYRNLATQRFDIPSDAEAPRGLMWGSHTHQSFFNTLPLMQLFNYLMGVTSFDAFEFSPKEGVETIRLMNLLEIAMRLLPKLGLQLSFEASSHPLRTRFLRESPHLTSPETYMVTLDSAKRWNEECWAESGLWMTEELEKLLTAYSKMFNCARVLHEKIKDIYPDGLVVGVSGNTASGKTTFLKNLLKQMFPYADDDEIEKLTKGILNVDLPKALLKRIGRLLNHQIHDQGSAPLMELIQRMIDMELNYFHDARLNTVEKVAACVIEPAKQMGKQVFFYDLDVSLEESLLRLLDRPLDQDEPCPTLSTVVNGFITMRKNRKKIIERLKNEKCVTYFELRSGDEVIAKKENGVFKKLNKDAYKKCTTVPSEQEIEKALQSEITKDLFEKAFPGRKFEESKIKRWENMAVGQAVFRHVSHDTASSNPKFGRVNMQPFNGSWLNPKLAEHIYSEHLLHIRGVDSKFDGLHWFWTKFGWSQNPLYNPERGFQMKLGYFLIPPHKEKELNLQKLGDLPKHILTQIRDETGTKFFVHPEAYRHYESLFDKGISFVKAEDSDFMGTPTSSYRSWLLRDVKNNKTPFIAKFGVLGAHGTKETTRLLFDDDVKKSVNINNALKNRLKKEPRPLIFEENLGLVIPGYSGNIIREVPEDLLEGRCSIFSFSALMSVERSKKGNQGLCWVTNKEGQLPLIYELIEESKLTTEEFIKKHIIDNFFDTFKEMHFELGYAFSPHGQNLSMVVPGFRLAYKDLEGMQEGPQGMIESIDLFFLYHILIKLLNVLVREEVKLNSNIIPEQRGIPQPEQFLYDYLKKHCTKDQEALAKYTICEEQYLRLFKHARTRYIHELQKHYDLTKLNIPLDDLLHSGEKRSVGETSSQTHNEELHAVRKN